ncbi:class III lanthionine synthetase LanKC [Streptomyces bohaiensis]|uniref:Protein kinase/lanthionine synthetase C family protein n=1 Tax=Streptomyces bohaiensis TaxID=1431344 RepID=A0ABX1CM19_9ACTN|nr:class III lanthionine synthetase LanKC [Streptomyces bohaiensis]NJQ17689.1 protein kinase/lanthionine synthetase C family protein [Streptomyces bohaiensis]
MNPEYGAFCGSDPHFYDRPRARGDVGGTPASDWYPAARGPLPSGWQRADRGDWVSWSPAAASLPQQGWKIHVSATLDNAPAVLERVVALCVSRKVPFKCVPSPALLLRRNAKYADRAGSGKFVTVYPDDERRLRELCEGLCEELAGEEGPDILSDLRCGSAPVHVRYGAFAARYCPAPDGRLVPAIADPDGTLVPDPREPGLRLPPWVELPEFLRPHLSARQATGLGDLPYQVETALHFSNGGGVYAARDTRTGERVVLKEGRPHAGLAADGADAVRRLGREREALETLRGLPCVPGLRDSFTVAGHHFLVLDHVAGTPLNTAFARRFPLSAAAPTAAELAAHTAWAHRVYALVERAVEQIHARGTVIGDLHMANVMLRSETGPDGTEVPAQVVLLDFEAASPAIDRRRQVVANPAFVAPSDRRGAAVDRYALACLRLALFLPLTTLFGLDRGAARRLADAAAEQFPVDRAALSTAVAEVEKGAPPPSTAAEPPSLTAWEPARDSMVRALLASATPERTDRCFPGDIAQFATPTGGLSLAHGAAGVLYALHAVGAPRCREAEEWLLARSKEPLSGSACGLHDGLAGVAWTLDRLGHPAQARELALVVAGEPLDALAPTLHGGQAGIALALDALAAGHDGPEAAALSAAAERCFRAVESAVREERPLPRGGLLHGGAGLALALVRRYERIGEARLLDLAATALRRDLARCHTQQGTGALMVREGTRAMPYLGAGSAGIAAVLDDYLHHRPDDTPLAEAREALLRATLSAFYIQPGLDRGVAGLVLYLARTSAGDAEERAGTVARHLTLLRRQAVPWQGELAFPGEQLMRLSMDLSTGTAGVLLALGSATGRVPGAHLPFLPPLGGPQTGPDPGAESEWHL